MTSIQEGRKPKWINHVLIWALVWVLVSGSSSLYDGRFARDFLSFFLQLPLAIGSAYLLFYKVIPDLWQKGNKLTAGILIFLIYLIVALGNRILMAYVIYPNLYSDDHTFLLANSEPHAHQQLSYCSFVV